jgi:hypothetical protein
MKYISKKFLNRKKEDKNSYYRRNIIWASSFLIIFFLGIWTERFNIRSQISSFSENLTNTLFNRVYSSFNSDKNRLIIDLKHKNYQKILESRNRSIKQKRATEDIHKWVSAKMNFKDKNYKVKIKLKGVHADHWSHPNKWSYKIKLEDSHFIDGMNRFSIQQPKTRDFLYEWIFMKILEKEKLIFHRTKFIETVVNGDNLGIYFLEEQHSKALIENNRRREGPIIGLDKSLWIKEVNNLNKLSLNVLEDTFWRARVKPVQFKKKKIGTEQETYLKDAISLFESFREGTTNLEEVFDLNQLAKLMSIKAIFGSVEFDWRDIKFYYNPITSLLEPIGREVHISSDRVKIQPWWVNNGYIESINSEQFQFINLLYQNKKFYKLYLTELFKMTEDDYITNIINENYDQFKKYQKILQINFPTKDIFSENYLKKIRLQIRNTITPIQGINAYYVDYSDNKIVLAANNTQITPVEITGVKLEKGKRIDFKNPYIIDGKKYNKPTKNILLEIPCNNTFSCEEFKKNKNQLIYSFLGQTSLNLSEIYKFYGINKKKIKKILDIDYLQKLPFLKIDMKKKEILFEAKKIIIDDVIVIPADFEVNFKPGTEIIFSKKGQIISYSALNIIGLEDSPIIIRSDFLGPVSTFLEKKKPDNNYGLGVSVINAKNKSVLKNVIFKRLASPEIEMGIGFLGSINFYNSDVLIEKSMFIENLNGDDYLNIVSSNFEIKDVHFNNIRSDAIDFDFSKGTIDNITIINSKNDGLDFSGSIVDISNILFKNIGDKAISAGEKSVLKILNLKVDNAKIAVASKDLSNVKLRNVEISNTKIAITAYQKKPEYGPAYITAEDILLKKVTNDFLVENNSEILINGKKMLPTRLDYSKF